MPSTLQATPDGTRTHRPGTVSRNVRNHPGATQPGNGSATAGKAEGFQAPPTEGARMTTRQGSRQLPSYKKFRSSP